jgi:membrane-bound lytic murein transglycosylase A
MNVEVAAMMREHTRKLHRTLMRCLGCVATALIVGCAATAPEPLPRSGAPQAPTKAEAAPKPPPSSGADTAVFTRSEWTDIPGWREDDLAESWPALLASCSVLVRQDVWRDVCAAAKAVTATDTAAARRFFEQRFTPYQVSSAESDEGLMTGYYEALLRGSRQRTERYRYPLYRVPDDLIVVDLAAVYPQLKGMRLRGRLEGRRLVPYFDRAEIDGNNAPLRGNEIAWVDDLLDLFFLQIQGSGRVALENGDSLRVGYAEQNGHPYVPIGRLLIERGALTREEVSMQSIKAWLRANPDRSTELLNSNPSYVFFRELPAAGEGPPGALGVPLTPRRSIAVDRRHIPLGAPVFISTTWPGDTRALERLTFAQDTGGAIRGVVRADFFWGAGEAAERAAGLMKERLRMWVLLPRGYPVPGSSHP